MRRKGKKTEDVPISRLLLGGTSSRVSFEFAFFARPNDDVGSSGWQFNNNHFKAPKKH